MIIAVDFDGTISRGKYPAIDGEQPYAGESLRKLYSQGHKIITLIPQHYYKIFFLST